MNAQLWNQVGININGEAAGDYSGKSVSLSSDGLIVAIGSPYNDESQTNAGQVRVYENISGTWTQIGQDINGGASGDLSGYSVSLSSDGSIVAIGSPENNSDAGQVRIYENISGTWTQIGQDINGTGYEHLGNSVSLSSNGSIIAIGSVFYQYNGGYNVGRVQVYENISGTWIQIGQDINAEDWQSDMCGQSVSLSSDGSIVAVGSVQASSSSTSENERGHVRVFENNGGVWTKIGQTIWGESSFDRFGYSASLSSNGDFLAIGARKNDGNGTDAGHVRVYEFTNGSWSKKGADINGEAAGDNSGYSACISSNGLIIAIGALWNDGNGTNAGHVRVYEYTNGTWLKKGADIDGEAAGDNSGCSVCLSSDGSIVAIGAYDANGSYAGHTKIYKFYLPPVITTNPVNQNNICLESNTSFSITGNNIETYQWQVNEGSGFADIINNEIYSNATTSMLSIQNITIGMNNFQYRCYVTNPIGNETSEVASLIIDSENPIITSTHDDQSIGNGTECTISLPDYTVDVVATDNCDSNLDITQNPTAGTTIFGVTNSVILTVTDDVGNTDEVIFNVEVVDNTNPEIISTHDNQTIDANANCEASLPNYTTDVTATDNCDTNLDIIQNPVIGTIISGITNTVTLTATDDVGNFIEVSFNVEVTDNIDPVITSTHNNQIVDADANCEATLLDYIGNVTATDNCDTNLDVTQNPIGGTTISGTTNTVTLTVTDDAGNTDEVTFIVEVIDNTSPVITSTHNNQLIGNGTECEVSLPDYTIDVTATDNCDISLDITQNPIAGASMSGQVNTITLTVTDDAGNTDEVSFNVEVIDNTSPVISSTHNDQTVDADENCEASLPDYTVDVVATDNCDTNLDIVQNPVAGTTITGATNPVTLTVTDDAVNITEVTFNIEVVDVTDPTITCIENQTFYLSEGQTTYTVSGTEFDPIATDDNCNVASVTNDFNSLSTLNGAVLPLGTNVIVWTVEDDAGNTSTCTFDVEVNAYNSINELAEYGISVYPNPSNGFFNIETEENYIITITDISGKELKQINSKIGKTEIDISNQATGTYFIEFRNSEIVKAIKIIKK